MLLYADVHLEAGIFVPTHRAVVYCKDVLQFFAAAATVNTTVVLLLAGCVQTKECLYLEEREVD